MKKSRTKTRATNGQWLNNRQKASIDKRLPNKSCGKNRFHAEASNSALVSEPTSNPSLSNTANCCVGLALSLRTA